jgi:hypothetical protein
VRGVRDFRECVTGLVDLGEYLSPLQIEAILAVLERETDENLRFELLERLASYVPESHLERAINLALTAPGSIHSRSAIETLASRLPSLSWPKLLKRAAASAAEARSMLFETLAEVAPDEATADAVLKHSADFDSQACSAVMLHLAIRLATLNQQARALELVEALISEFAHDYFAARALATMAPMLDQPELAYAVGIARKRLIAEPDAWVDAVAALGRRLAVVYEASEALDLLRTIPDAINRVLVPQGDGSRRISLPHLSSWPQALEEVARRGGSEIANEVLELARVTGSWKDRAEAVARVAARLKFPLPSDVIESVLGPADPRRRAWIVSETLPWFAAVLPKLQFQQRITVEYSMVLEAATEHRGSSVLRSDLRFLERLAPWWPADTLSDAVSFAAKGEPSRQGTAALGALLRRMLAVAGPLEALRRATEAPWREDSAELLRSLVDLLPAEIVNDVFDSALRLGKAVDRARGVAAIAPRIATLPLDVGTACLQKLLTAEAHSTRQDLLKMLVAFAPPLARRGGVEAVRRLAESVQDVSRWWP